MRSPDGLGGEARRQEAPPVVGWQPSAVGPTAPTPVAGRYHALRALRHPGYRAYFLAQALSFAGTWMQSVALGWLVFRLTGSTLLLGSVTFASQLPTLLLAPFAGVLADRLPLTRMVAVTQASLALVALAMAALIFSDRVTVEAILALATVGGVASAFDQPARQTLLVELAGPADLSSAIALSSAAVNSARIVGPAIAGVLVASVGEAVCFLINGLTFSAPIAVALLVRPAHARAPSRREGPLAALRAGLRYARTAPHTRTMLPLVAITSIVAFPYLPMLPAFAGDVLGGGPALLGWLNVAVGAGSVTGALAVAALVDRRRLLPRAALGLCAYGIGLVGLGLSRVLAASLPALLLVGFGMLSLLSSANTIVQGDTPEGMRGRVMALYTTVLVGLFPIGAIVCGALADRVGVGPTFAAGGVVTLLCGVWLARRLPALRARRVGEGVAAGAGLRDDRPAPAYSRGS